MRTDLTIRTPDGTEVDVAVTAPEATTFAQVAGLLEQAVPGARPAWSGRQWVHPDAVVGRDALVTGAILTCDRGGDEMSTPGARLEIVGGLGAGRGVAVTGRTLTVGREPSCDLVVPDARASRQHAVFTVTAAATTVRDLGSTHGTRIDGVSVTGDGVVPPGSVVRVGDSFLAVTAAIGQATGQATGRTAATRDGPGGAVLVNRQPRARAKPDERVIDLPAPPRGEFSPRVRWVASMVPALAGAGLAWLLHSLLFLAFAALTPVALLAGALGDRLHGRRSRRRAVAAHRRVVARAEDEIRAALRQEATLRRGADPDPATVHRIAHSPTARLWERGRSHDDLMRVRIGLASVPSALRVDRVGTVSPAADLDAVPCTVDLGDGPVGIAAPAPVRDGLARWLLVQLAVLASPADVEIALVLSDDRAWAWARWLPHLKGRVAATASERMSLVDDLADLVRARRDGRREHRDWTGPRLVVVLDRLGTLGCLPRLGALLADGATVGLTALCLADQEHELPAACTRVVRAAGELGSTAEIGTAVVVADRVDVRWADGIARALAPMADPQADPAAALPLDCRLAQLLGTDPPSAVDTVQSWAGSDGSASTVLGLCAGGPVVVDLERDGPHVLIAGTTGSGKSELLQTLVTGLAAGHPPAELTFLLVDYKGGAAFAECADLPHTVGLVTDLDEHLTKRVLAALDSEIRRREALLSGARAQDLAAYRASGAILPRLVLVVDEFATLAEQFAGFVPGLVGIAQRGRSLGLHLVLATQRPAGVVSPEIRANTALRIALRVTSAAESVDVIDGPDAAGIHRRSPGRGYLRVGTTTLMFQAARVAGGTPAGVRDRIRAQVLDSWRRAVDEAVPADESDLCRYVRAIRAAAADQPSPRRPWLPPLPTALTLAKLPASRESPEHVPIGVVDLPAEQRQDALAIDLRGGGPVLIVGSARSGRTTALLSLVFAASDRCSPADLHVHAVDAGSGLAALSALPHLGTRAAVQQGMDLVARLVQRLQAELERRREMRVDQPRLVLLVDGWEGLLAGSEEYDGGRTVDRLLALLRDAPAAHATVVITGGRAALAPRLAAQMATRLVLPLHDPGDYAQAGVDLGSVPGVAIPGRGIRATDGAEFQIAHPGAVPATTRWRGVESSPLRLRALPRRVTLDELRPGQGRCVLGVGGDEAVPIVINPTVGVARLLVAGPARAGRSTLLCTVLRQNNDTAIVAAPHRSRLSVAALAAGLHVLGPEAAVPELPARGLLLVDDVEAFADTAVGEALTGWVRADRPGRAAIVAGRSDAFAVAFRGLGAEIRQSRCGVLLQPGPVDGELLGVSLPRARASAVPGRGLLIPDPSWRLGDTPLPIQVALP